ncbi:MAG: hypothetical protein CME65_09300 [Halobacteriovoraceae bacterium]|nr:hypothetical protein [Halobacteriovoraceae bacterium]|tara:strand:+ start:12437 stop:15067 length:2631 start_codon:yes stop_codon:yes gene_type:complete
MRNKILLILYKARTNLFFQNLYILYYKLALAIVKFVLSRISFVKHAYLKGSYNQRYFEPVISDLDFFLVGEVTPDNSKRLEKVFSFFNNFFPIVSDYDFYSEEDATYLYNFGDFKFLSVSRWIHLKGEPPRFQYRYHPRKFYLDIVNEIYFQLEWLFKNLKNREEGDLFKTLKIQRQYDKIKDILNYLHDHQTYELRRRKLKPNFRWAQLSNEEIIWKFNSLISRNIKLQELKNIILGEFADWDVQKILREPYYQKNLVLIDDPFVYAGKSHYFTRELFMLFYYAGCIDSYLVYDWAINKTGDRLSSLFLRGQYYCKLIEGRENMNHGADYLNSKREEFKNLLDAITSSFPVYETPPPNVFGSNVIVIPYEEKKDSTFSQKAWLDSLPKDLACNPRLKILFVCHNNGNDNSEIYYQYSINDSTIDCATLHIYDHYRDPHCDKYPALYSIGMSWIFGANKALLFDRDLVLNSEIIEHSLEVDYENFQFSLLKALPSKSHPFFIASKIKNLQLLDFDTMISWDLYNIEKLRWLLSQKTELNGYERTFITENFGVMNWRDKTELIELDIDFEFQGRDQSVLVLTLLPVFKGLLEFDILGFLKPVEFRKEVWYQLGYLCKENNYYSMIQSAKDTLGKVNLPQFSYFSDRLPGVIKSGRESFAAIVWADETSFKFSVVNPGQSRIEKSLELYFPFDGFYLLDIEVNLNRFLERSYFRIHAAVEGHKTSGTVLNLETRSDGKASSKIILYAPSGTQKVKLEIDAEIFDHCEPEIRVCFDQPIEPKNMEKLNFESYSQLEEYLYSISGKLLVLEVKLPKITSGSKVYLEKKAASYPSHYNEQAGLIRSYGLVLPGELVKLVSEISTNDFDNIVTYESEASSTS